MSDIPADLAAAMAESPPPQPNDKLKTLRDMIAHVRDLEQRKEDLEHQLEDLDKQLSGKDGYYLKKIPDLMDEAGVSAITIEAQGNLPAVEAKVVPFFSAQIAASWPEEKRQAAFRYLDESGHGDLIKTTVSVKFPREKRKDALAFAKQAQKYGAPNIREEVHMGTLTAWLKEQFSKGHIVDLEKIGGNIGRIAQPKPKKTR